MKQTSSPGNLYTNVMKRMTCATALALTCVAPLRAQCRSGGELLAQAPSATFLRAYRPALGAPSRLAIDGARSIHIADPAGGRVVVRSADGRVIRILDQPEYPVSVAIDAGGNVLVGEGRRGRVDVYALDGRRVASLGSGDGELGFPADIDVNAATGEVFVADSRGHVVKRYGAAGNLLQTMGSKGTAPGQFDVPSAILVDAQRDELLVADQRNGRLQVLRLNGEFAYCIAATTLTRCGGGGLMPCGQLRQADQGIWADAAGRIYIADSFEGRVLVIDRNGNLLSTIGAFGNAPGELDGPSDIVIDAQQRLFVSSADNARVEIFGLDGYADAEVYAPARMVVTTDPVDSRTATMVVARVEVPGYRMDGVAAGSFVANETAAATSVVVENDADGDGVDELVLTFGADLVRTLPVSGTAEIVVRGPAGALRFEVSDTVAVQSSTPPATTKCPCDAPWKNHGDYVSCVVEEATELHRKGLVTRQQFDQMMEAARNASCGKK